MAKYETDTNGIVTTPGRFQGRHIDEVMDYLDGLEAAVTAGGTNTQPPAGTPPAGEKTEAEKAVDRLKASAANRIDPLQELTFQRLEQDDEAAFIATVEDYDVYKAKIDKLKQGMHPATRAQKNLHRTLYINVKSEDPKVRSAIYKRVDAAVEPPVEPVVEPPVVVPPARGPKAAPPMAAPTPASRPAPAAAAGGERKSKLVPTDKIRQFCRVNRQDVDAYMLKLEDQGETQESINNAGQLGRREQPRSVYDRPRAVR